MTYNFKPSSKFTRDRLAKIEIETRNYFVIKYSHSRSDLLMFQPDKGPCIDICAIDL
jgi:hypothetical protein